MINQQRLVELFSEMVSIDSESGEEQEFAQYLVNKAQVLGYSSHMDEYWNVYVEVDGEGDGLMLNTHMDTVKPGKGIKPQVKEISGETYIVSAGDTILGADPKATIAVLFELLNIFKENDIKHQKLLLTFSCQEEQGIPTVDKIKTNIKTCIVPDRGIPTGKILVSGPYAQVFEVKVNGKSAYATTNFADGKHAIKAAAEIISLLEIGNIDINTAANIGIIEGGLMTSTVPDSCSFKGNCYSTSKKSFDKFFATLTQLLKSVDRKYGTHSELEFLEYFPGFDLGKNHQLAKKAVAAIKAAGIEPEFVADMAVSNANILNGNGIETVLISYGAENAHTTNERISLTSLTKLAQILLNLVN